MNGPRPRVRPKPVPTTPNPPTPLGRPEKARLRRLATRATELYPGPVGELAARELLAWEEFGYRVGNGSLMHRLADDIEQRWNAEHREKAS